MKLPTQAKPVMRRGSKAIIETGVVQSLSPECQTCYNMLTNGQKCLDLCNSQKIDCQICYNMIIDGQRCLRINGCL